MEYGRKKRHLKQNLYLYKIIESNVHFFENERNVILNEPIINNKHNICSNTYIISVPIQSY